MEENIMGYKPILPLVARMSIPTMISMIITGLYNVVDSIYVARIGSDALTAVSLAFPLQNLIMAIALGVGIGVNSSIARTLGEGKSDVASNIACHGIIIAFISYILFVVFALCSAHDFLGFFTSSQPIIFLGVEYLKTLSIFSFGLIIHITIEKILQSTGEMFLPMIFQAIGAITNIILDPIFIFGGFNIPAYGVKGAAIATIISQILAMVLAIYTLFFKKNKISVNFGNFRFDYSIVKSIFNVGLPTIFIQSLGSILVICLNSLLISYSEIAVAFMGIFFKLQTFVYMAIEGLRQGILPIVGYNYGASNGKRVFDTIKVSVFISLIFTISGTLVCNIFPIQIISLFDASEDMLSIGVNALKILSICFIPATFGIVFITIFQSLGMGFYSLIICLIRQIAIIIPLSYVLSGFIGLTGIWITFVIAEIIGALLSIILFKKVVKNDKVFNIYDANL